MTRLHEVLAVESDKEGIAKRIIAETAKVFKDKHHVFIGQHKVLKMDVDSPENTSLEEASEERQEITSTVPERVAYTEASITDWLDVVLQKEATNQQACADIIIDGEIIATNLPATFLLGLETKLKHIREVYNSMPTLPPGPIWIKDEAAELPDVYRTQHPEIKAKTKKLPQHKVLVEATQHHRAEIEKWNEEVVVGKYTTNFQSGMISASTKSRILSKVDDLAQAVKQARMRANNAEVVETESMKAMFNFIHS